MDDGDGVEWNRALREAMGEAVFEATYEHIGPMAREKVIPWRERSGYLKAIYIDKSMAALRVLLAHLSPATRALVLHECCQMKKSDLCHEEKGEEEHGDERDAGTGTL